MRKLQCALLLLLGIANVDAQQRDTLDQKLSRSSFGIGGGLSRAAYSTRFSYLPGYPGCSPLFTDGSGVNRTLGVSCKLRFGENFSFITNATYSNGTGSLAVDETSTLNVDGVAQPAVFHHAIDFTTGSISVQPGVAYRLFGALDLNLAADLRYVLSASFNAREAIAQPADRGVFTDTHSRLRDVYSGSIPNLNRFQNGLVAGVSYFLPLNTRGTLGLKPSAQAEIGFSNLVSGLHWRENSIGASIGIEYRPAIQKEEVAPKPEIKPVPVVDTVKAQPHVIASISATGLYPDNVEEPGVILRIEEKYQTQLVPLVPYIFFDAGSATVPERYLQSVDASHFAESKLSGSDPLSVYRQSLNIIGKRLTDHPTATVSLTGTLDNSEIAACNSLAMERARAIKEILVRNWNIAPSRIQTHAEALPAKASVASDSDGLAENRRVEIASKDAAITAPVLIADTVRTSTPPAIRFRPKATGDNVRSWALQTSQDGKTLKSFSGTDSLPQTIDWELAEDQTNIPRAPGVLDYTLNVQSVSGSESSAKGSMPVEQRTLRTKRREIAGNAEIEKYTLLLFDFNSSELSSDNRGMLDLIKSRIKQNSALTIQGFGDRIGTVTYNKSLALARAKSAAKALSISDESILPSDGRTYPQDNSLPEGRFYSRTVEITIKTPLIDRE